MRMKKLATILLALVMIMSILPTNVVLATEAAATTVNTADAFVLAMAAGGNVVLGESFEMNTAVKIPAGVSTTLDLNGKTITATESTKGANFNLIVNNGTLEIKDSVGGGKISLTATVNKGFSNSSSIISNEAGMLTITGGTLEHKGGSDMAYGIDNNSTLGETTLYVNGGTVISPYRAVRLFQNNTTKQNTVQINGGKLNGDVCVWMHQPSANHAQLGTLKVTGGVLESATRAIVVDIMGGSKSDITISGGTFTNASKEKNLLLVWPFSSMKEVSSDNKTTLKISGGTFDCAGEGKLIGLLDGADANTEVTVSGGTFSESIADAYLAEGVESVAIADKGVWVVHAHDNKGVIEAKDATCTEAGNTAGTKCSVCDKLMSGNEVVSAGHKPVKVEAKAATCTDAGYVEHYKCACGKLFNNEKGEKELAAADVAIAAAGHKPVKVEAKAATCTDDGYIEHYKCACGKLFSDEKGEKELAAADVAVAAAGHKPAKVEAKAATCTDAGYIEHYKCACGKLFSDEKAEKELADADVVVAAAGHKPVKVEAKAATYTAAGNTEYYKCACGALFADAEGKTATTAEAVVLAQLIKIEDAVAKVESSAVDKAIEEAKKDTATSEKVEVVIKVEDAKTEENTQEVQKVVEVELPVESLETVAEQKAELTVELPSATVTMDTEALTAVTKQAEGQTVSLVVKEVKTETLTDKQQKAAKKYDVATVVSAELICQQTGEKIWTEADNKNVTSGKITVRIPFTPEAGAKGSDYGILYVAVDGSTKKIDSKYEDGCLVFTLEHFSDYIIFKEEQKPAAATPETGDKMLGLLGVTAMLSAAGVATLVFLKKRVYR